MPQTPTIGSAYRIRLAFIDPGLRKAPFFLALRRTLAPGIECVYWSQRPIVRSYMRSAGVAMHPGDQHSVREHPITDAELQRAIGDKELALRPERAWRHARQLVAKLATFLDAECIDAILVWNGSNLRSALAIHLARQRGLPVIHAEHGYLPGTTQLDLEGVNFNASITTLARHGVARLPPDAAIDAALDASIARFRTGAAMADHNPLLPDDLRRNVRARLASHVGLWAEKRLLPYVNRRSVPQSDRPLPSRFVLLPFQVRRDSQLVLHSPLYGNDMEAVVRELDAALMRIDPALSLVAKFHPAEMPQVQHGYRALARRYPRVHFVSDVPMRDLLERAEAVVTINSTAGFEAMFCDKRVLTLGRNFYTVPGLVDCLARRADLEQALRTTLASAPDRAQRRAFLRYVHAHFLACGNYHDFSERSLRTVAARVTELLGGAQMRAGLQRERVDLIPA